MRKVITAVLQLLVFCYLSESEVAIRPPAKIPVFDDVDVLVVGGGSGGVAAAVAAAKEGARVFLISERSFVGEDICSTYRLWLEPGEVPTTELAKAVFKPVEIETKKIGVSLPFTYTADKPSVKPHKDTDPPRLLSDGKWSNAANASVQYDEEVVNIVAKLEQEQTVAAIHLLVYQRMNDFEVEQVSISHSLDGIKWTPIAEIKNQETGRGNYEGDALPLSVKFQPVKTRYLKFAVQRSQDAKRMLLGEIVIESDVAKKNDSLDEVSVHPVTPMQVKRTFDRALIDAGVKFLFWSYPVDIVRDNSGNLAGIVILNRSGQQAILAKTIIDATMHSVVAKIAGVKFTQFPAGTREFYRVVVGGKEQKAEAIATIKRQQQIYVMDRKGERYPVFEYKIFLQQSDNSFSSIAQVEQMARDLTWTKECVDSSEVLFEAQPQNFKGIKSVQKWEGIEKLPVECFQPVGFENLYVINGTADVSRDIAEKIVRPVNIMAIGEKVGKRAFDNSKLLNINPPFKIAGKSLEGAVNGEIRFAEQAAWHRIAGDKQIPQEKTTLPIFGEYDVVVVGGGTGGAPAAIAAGRKGAKTLLIEHLYSLGGVGTSGLISSYYHGNRVGFTKEVDAGVAQMGGIDARTSSGWIPDIKSEWYRRELRKANVDIWFGCIGAGAFVENNRVKGVVVSTPAGTGVVLAKVVIDATGNADIAAAAGAKCRYTDDSEIAVQGAGLPQKELGSRYTNTDYTFVDDNDIVDIWRVFVVAREKFKWAYDLGQLIDTRERRQIVGDYTLTPMDMMIGKTFKDTVVICKSDFDSHGHTVHPLFLLRPPDRKSIEARLPYRSLLPAGIDGVIVTGLSVSSHRDALPVIRMQADVQNQGYAMGLAAAMIAKEGISTRNLNIRELQKQLVEKGILPESILNEEDSKPLPDSQISDAVKQVVNNYDKLEVILAYPERAIPMVETAFNSTTTFSNKLIYAHILGMFGNNAGIDILIDVIKKSKWDKGWRYTGMGQYGASISQLDSYIIAAGKTRDRRAVEPILEKAEQLTPQSEFSHFRAVALALENLNDSRACPLLAKLLTMPGISGNAIADIKRALVKNPSSGSDTTTRNAALTELVIARALYKCGDYQGLGEKTLRQYSQDIHGHYARHSAAVLRSKK
ncbi:MAG: FAD-dependent oxidoreductase [Verrucomicrobiia bacterium]